MFIITKSFLLLIAVQVALIKANSLPSDIKNYEKVFLKAIKPVDSLFVSADHYEPFIYQNKNGKFYNGIEFKLLKTIAKKENLEVVFIKDFEHKHRIFE